MTQVIHGATGARGAPAFSVLAAAGTVATALARNADAVITRAQVMGDGPVSVLADGPAAIGALPGRGGHV